MTDAVLLYDKLIQSYPNIERKGKTTPYTSMNGHMYSFLSKEGVMGLRLSKQDRESFIERHNSQLMIQHGRTMSEYVQIPNSLLKDTESLSKYFVLSFEYVSSLKPKSTKKKK